MYECHQTLMRLRQGDSERDIARSGLMERAKAARFHTLGQSWIEPSRPLPPDTEIAPAPPASSALTGLPPSSSAGSARRLQCGDPPHAEHSSTGQDSSVRRPIAPPVALRQRRTQADSTRKRCRHRPYAPNSVH